MGISMRVSGPVGSRSTHRLERLQRNGSSTRPVMAQIAQVAVDANREQFTQLGAHYSARWAPLSPAYRLWKERVKPGRPVMVFTGRLKKHAAPVLAKNAGVYRVKNRSMEVGFTYAQVPYAKHHQNGGVGLPQRLIMGKPTREDQKKMVKVLHRHLMVGVR